MVRYLPSLSECPLSYKLRRDGRLASGHLRTRSYPSHRPKRTYCKNCSGADSSSFMHCTPKPPANKKLCSSLSLPDNESSERQLSWVPRASSVWQPVEHCGAKPRSISCPDEKMKLAESMRINNEMEAISTPPASPTPRPASANAALGDKNTVFKNESAHCNFAGHDVRDLNFNWKPNVLCLHRSRSQPCFDRMRTIGVKRRIDEVLDARRPALDLSKMEEVLRFNFNFHHHENYKKLSVLILEENLNNHWVVLNNLFLWIFHKTRVLNQLYFPS